VRRRGLRGFTLVEVLVVALALGLMAAIAIPAYTYAMAAVKIRSLGATLADVQSAADVFYAHAAAWPAYGQPGPCPDAFEVDPGATDNLGNPFEPWYLRFSPDSSAATWGLSPQYGSQVYYGIATGGKVFATQTPPGSNGEWTSGNLLVYVQESVIHQPPYESLDQLCSGGSGLAITISASSYTVTPGNPVTFSGTVTDNGAPVAGAAVTVTITGSVTGASTYSTNTNSQGAYSVQYTSQVAQYLEATASTTG